MENGARVTQKLVELDPKYGASYVLLANTFSAHPRKQVLPELHPDQCIQLKIFMLNEPDAKGSSTSSFTRVFTRSGAAATFTRRGKACVYRESLYVRDDKECNLLLDFEDGPMRFSMISTLGPLFRRVLCQRGEKVGSVVDSKFTNIVPHCALSFVLLSTYRGKGLAFVSGNSSLSIIDQRHMRAFLMRSGLIENLTLKKEIV
ncbi:hypothetical protein SELMODRAFT_415631 [Selaginella moellendorffii]|uniref:Uncharacterized protein n=1 Tax=Selaginella moellendorffii TaxID=88036 RepID=D8RWR4_SELML|nr:hypothetical protein SELMODRAFT_415631 [Selaginella moellendorffii]